MGGNSWESNGNSRPLPNPFRIEPNNAYGRGMLAQQQRTHDKLISRAIPLTDCHISRAAIRQLQFREESQNWRPGAGELERRRMDDEVLATLINSSVSRLDCRLDAHVLAFKAHRMRNPNHIPGWLELQEQQKHHSRHQRILRGEGIRSRVDCAPPRVALRYASFLKSARFTKGGAPRVVEHRNTRKHRRKKREKEEHVPKPERTHSEEDFANLPMRRHQAMSVMGVAGEPKFHHQYEVTEVPLSNEPVRFPPIGNRHKASEPASEAEYEDEFEDGDTE